MVCGGVTSVCIGPASWHREGELLPHPLLATGTCWTGGGRQEGRNEDREEELLPEQALVGLEEEDRKVVQKKVESNQNLPQDTMGLEL